MICSEFFELLDNYESLTGEQRIEMENHAAECETCRNELEFFKSVMSNLKSIPSPKAPDSLIANVNAKLDAEKPVAIGFRWNFRVLSTVAACLAIGLAVGINNGYIKDTITENSTDGVISETVVNTSEDEGKNPVIETAETVETTEASDVSDPVVATSKPQKADEADGKEIKVSKTTSAVTATSKPAKTEEPKPEKVEEIPVATNPPAPTPDNSPDVEDYEIKEDAPQIAYGYYNVERARHTPNVISDYLHVESDDMGTVVSTMSEMGVKNSGGYYMTSRQNFYALMDTLNDKGVGYECDLQYNSGENISFRLTYN